MLYLFVHQINLLSNLKGVKFCLCRLKIKGRSFCLTATILTASYSNIIYLYKFKKTRMTTSSEVAKHKQSCNGQTEKEVQFSY